MANEKRLIDAKALLESLWQIPGGRPQSVVNLICATPTVDAVEVVHGFWIDGYNVDHIGRITEHTIDCSVCDSVFKDDSRAVVKHWKERFKECPFCGAKMDGDSNE